MKLRALYLAGISGCCLFLLGSCESHPNAAFPTAQTVAARAGANASSIATFELGRKIYTTSCTECHVARPIGDYSVERWRYYIGIMAPRAGLAPTDQAALESYVVAARQSWPAGANSPQR